jgi:hypothetical protein
VVTETSETAPIHGRALLVGAPLDGLRGVEDCVTRMASFLALRGIGSRTLVGTDARWPAVEAALRDLLAEVQPGDTVVFYFAGHGLRSWKPGEQVYPLLLTMDTWESSPDDPRAIIGFELDVWINRIAIAAAYQGTTNMTVILECCHAAGMVDSLGLDGPGQIRGRAAVAEDLTARAKGRRRGPVAESVEDQVVRIVASGTFSRAYGDGTKSVGAVTHALIDLLERYPDEPWLAIEHRLRAKIHHAQPHQWPGVEGRRERLPLLVKERRLPLGVLPCIPTDAGHWHCVLSEVLAAKPGGLYRLTEDPASPGGLTARMVDDGVRLDVLGEAGPVDVQQLRWAVPMELARGVRVCERPRDGRRLSTRLIAELRRHGVLVESVESAAAGDGDVVLAHDGLGIALHDAWGEPVVRWKEEPPAEVLLSWVVRAAELGQWLSIAHEPSTVLKGTFELSWGVRTPEGLDVTVDEGGEVSEGTTCWFRLDNAGAEPRLFLSVFRITGGWAIEHLTRQSAGGAPSVKGRPARIEAVFRAQNDVISCWETVVAVITIRPLPMHLLERPPLRRDGSWKSPARSMVVYRYRLVDGMSNAGVDE